MLRWFSFFFFFNDTATTEIYTLSLHDALPILMLLHSCGLDRLQSGGVIAPLVKAREAGKVRFVDRKSTRLNSSHVAISYAVFCLKKKKQTHNHLVNTTTWNVLTAISSPSC